MTQLDTERLEKQVAHALLRPAARLASACGLSLRSMTSIMQTSYFHELQRDGLKMREITQRLGISMRKAAQLSSQLKQTYFEMYRDEELPRRIEFLLWAQPLSRARILQTLPSITPEDVDHSLNQLLEQGRIVEVERSNSLVYERRASDSRLVSDRVFARLDGLQHLLGTVYNVIFARFFHGDEHSFARTVSLRLSSAKVAELERFYNETIWKKLTELEAESGSAEDAVEMDVSILWSPSLENKEESDDGK